MLLDRSANVELIFSVAVVFSIALTDVWAFSPIHESKQFTQFLGGYEKLCERHIQFKDQLPNYPDLIINQILPNLNQLEEIGDAEITACTYWLLGLSYYLKEEYTLSNFYFKKVNELDPTQIPDRLKISVSTNIGANYNLLEEPELAIEYYEVSLQFYRAMGNDLIAAQLDLIIGTLYNRLGELDRAIVITKRSLDVFKDFGEEFYVSLATKKLGNYYLSLGEESAIEMLYEAEKNFEALCSTIISNQRV